MSFYAIAFFCCCLTFNPWDSFTLLHVVILQLFSLLYNILSHGSPISTYSFMVDLLIDIRLLLFFSFLVITYMSLFSPWIDEQFFFNSSILAVPGTNDSSIGSSTSVCLQFIQNHTI